jgi:hypothetical protein
MYYTYGHYRADSNKLFYIGKGKGNRAYEKDSRSGYWKNIVNKHGYSIEIFAKWPSEKEAFTHEKFLIECFRDLTELCNFTNGGEGCSGYVWSEEQKAKIKGRTPTNFGKKASEETRKKIGDVQRGKKRGPQKKEHSEKISLANKGKEKTPEQAERLRQMAKETASVVRTCPNCGHEGRGPNMYRFHFKNCQR